MSSPEDANEKQAEAEPFPFPLGKKPSAADGEDTESPDARPLNQRISRHLIHCDNPNCGTSNPPLVCPDCDAAYFCDETCRSADADDDHGHTCYSDKVLNGRRREKRMGCLTGT